MAEVGNNVCLPNRVGHPLDAQFCIVLSLLYCAVWDVDPYQVSVVFHCDT